MAVAATTELQNLNDAAGMTIKEREGVVIPSIRTGDTQWSCQSCVHRLVLSWGTRPDTDMFT